MVYPLCVWFQSRTCVLYLAHACWVAWFHFRCWPSFLLLAGLVSVPDVRKMTLAEKVGQMMIIDHLALSSPADVAAYHIGNIVR